MRGEPFDPHCVRCARLAGFLRRLRQSHPDYHNAPVPSFGDPDARLLIVGLAPGMHGANASGRPFTGDYAGILLYRCLFEAGLSTAPESLSADDGLELRGCRIANAVRCLPPQNKPQTEEVRNCNPYLLHDLERLASGGVVLALGTVAHGAVLRAAELQLSRHPFAHGAVHDLPGGRQMVDSYHCSRYNTQTGRLTTEMFETVLRRAKTLAFES